MSDTATASKGQFVTSEVHEKSEEDQADDDDDDEDEGTDEEEEAEIWKVSGVIKLKLPC